VPYPVPTVASASGVLGDAGSIEFVPQRLKWVLLE